MLRNLNIMHVLTRENAWEMLICKDIHLIHFTCNMQIVTQGQICLKTVTLSLETFYKVELWNLRSYNNVFTLTFTIHTLIASFCCTRTPVPSVHHHTTSLQGSS